MNIPINFVTFFVLKVLRKTYSVLNGLFLKKSSNDDLLLFDRVSSSLFLKTSWKHPC